MFEKFNSVRTVFEHSKSTVALYVDKLELDAVEQELYERISNSKPIVMVYGVYNAGKSTLLNALVGQEVAEVGDIPKTARVSRYKVGDVDILDTPGIDAPIEHEEVSREQLAKSDAVIFVLSSDGVVDEQQTYNEIGKILEAGKPLIVVINNRSNHKESDDEFLILKDQFRSNLYKHFENNGLILSKLDETQEFLVNAKVALKGKLEKKDKLVEFSKIRELEQAVTRLFEQTNSSQVAKTLAYQINELLEKGIQHAESGVDSDELKKLSEWISKAKEAQLALEYRIKAKAEKAKPSLKININSSITAGRESEVQQCVEAWSSELIEYFQNQLERTIKHLDLEAELLVRVLSKSPSFSQYFPVNEETEKESSGIASLITGFTMKQGKSYLTDDLMKEGIVFALKKGKAIAPEMFKGIGKKTMEKMASKAIPFIGPAIDVLMAAYEFYKAKEQERLQIAIERQRLESINANVNKLVDDLYDNFFETISDSLEDTFKPMLLPLEMSLVELSAQQGGVESDMRALKRSQENLAVLITGK